MLRLLHSEDGYCFAKARTGEGERDNKRGWTQGRRGIAILLYTNGISNGGK